MVSIETAYDHGELSLEDWAAMPEDEPGELVDGRLEEEEMPDLLHEILVSWLIRTLGTWFAPRGGFVFGSEAKLAVSASRGRKPDVTAYGPDRPPLPARGIVSVPPDIAIEIVSPTPRDGRRDRVEKLADYAAFGVRSYWLVEPEQRIFEVFELGPDGRYIHAAGATAGRVEDIAGYEGLVIDVDAMWAELERLA